MLLRTHCPNIHLIVLAPAAPVYVQVKSSENVTISGAPCTEAELYHGEPIFNKHPGWQAGIIFILDRVTPDLTDYYMAPPGALERLVRPRAELFAAKPELDRQPRSLAFRRQLPREMLKPWKNAWPLLTGDVPDRAA